MNKKERTARINEITDYINTAGGNVTTAQIEKCLMVFFYGGFRTVGVHIGEENKELFKEAILKEFREKENDDCEPGYRKDPSIKITDLKMEKTDYADLLGTPIPKD